MLNVCLSVCRERCGVIKIRQPGVQRHWRERETVFQNGPAGLRRLARKRYIDLGNDQSQKWLKVGFNFDFLYLTLIDTFPHLSCRWGRSRSRQEQVRCTGLWHSAEGGPEVHAPLTTQCPWLASLSKLQQHPSNDMASQYLHARQPRKMFTFLPLE